MCGAPGRPYVKGYLCDEHARAQGITPREKREEMPAGFGGQTEAIEPEVTDAEVVTGPWTATVTRNYERVSVTFKHGTAFDEPWVVFKADTPEEVSELIADFRNREGFAAVATIAGEFRGAKSAQGAAVAAVQTAMPGTQVVSQPAAQPPAQPAAQCDKCGAPAEFKAGVSQKSGKSYKMFKCTADGDHVRFVN